MGARGGRVLVLRGGGNCPLRRLTRRSRLCERQSCGGRTVGRPAGSTPRCLECCGLPPIPEGSDQALHCATRAKGPAPAGRYSATAIAPAPISPMTRRREITTFPSHCPVLITHLPRAPNRNQYEARLFVLACPMEQVVQVWHFAFAAKASILSPAPRVLRKEGDERLALPARRFGSRTSVRQSSNAAA